MSSTGTWGALEPAISGGVILPGSPDYQRTYRALNARFDDVRPHAVVRCGTPQDVAECIHFARQQGMAVATRGGGHCFGGRSSTEGLLVDVTPMHSVEISGGAVTVGGGTRLGEVYESLLERDLTIPAGSCPSVGIAGLALGGGLGIIGRKYGLTSDHLLGVQIVLADGRVLECNDHHEEDLFWALRGGGRPGQLRGGHRPHLRNRPGTGSDELPPNLAFLRGRGRDRCLAVLGACGTRGARRQSGDRDQRPSRRA